MLDFLAEAAVLWGLLAYGRSRPEAEEPAEGEAERSDVNAGSGGGAPQPESRPRGASDAVTVITGAAQRAWAAVSGWFGGAAAPRDRGTSDAPRSGPPRAARSRPAGSPTGGRSGRNLWPSESPYGVPSRGNGGWTPPPDQARAPDSGPSEARGPADREAAASSKPGAPPALVRDPVCGLELPWARSVSLRMGAETLYFCSDTCRALYVRGRSHG
jgi:YHS domain-containing protein